jgi:hypothetical protein
MMLFMNRWTQVNIILFASQAVIYFIACFGMPENVLVHGFSFALLYPSGHALRTVRRLGAMNMVFNWIKLIFYIRWIPRYSLLFRTFSYAARPIANFFVVFGFVFTGFAVAFGMLFSHGVYEFRTMFDSVLGLLRILLGDLDFSDLIAEDPIMGPFLVGASFTFAHAPMLPTDITVTPSPHKLCFATADDHSLCFSSRFVCSSSSTS